MIAAMVAGRGKECMSVSPRAVFNHLLRSDRRSCRRFVMYVYLNFDVGNGIGAEGIMYKLVLLHVPRL
jgi:hypothetical protein